MIVPPGTAASAAALTLLAVPSVSSVSFGPCFMVAGSLRPFDADELAEGEAVGVCAPAMWLPARMPPARSPLATRPAAASRLRPGGLACLSVT
jgi:hypothetical protein